MQRRNFIKTGLLATGAFSIPLAENEIFAARKISTPPVSADFRKSIVLRTVGVEGSVLDKCKAVKEAGFQGIEPQSHMNREEVINAAKAADLAITGVCCSTHGDVPLSHPDAGIRQKGIDGAIVALEDAETYGTDSILLVPGFVTETVSYDECWNRSVECIRKLIPVAEKMKVTICIENVWNYFLLSPMEACRYVDQFNSPYIKFYFDCGNIMAFGWPEQWIRILGDRIGRIHIKEYSRQPADKQGRYDGFKAPLTEGDVNWCKIMDALCNSYKNVWLTTEYGKNKTFEELKDLSMRFDKIISCK